MSRSAAWLVAGLGLLLVVAGGVVFAAADGVEQVWYDGSYEPLAGASSSAPGMTSDDAVVWARAHLVGLGLAGAGVVLLAAEGGWLLSRRGSAAPRAPAGPALHQHVHSIDRRVEPGVSAAIRPGPSGTSGPSSRP